MKLVIRMIAYATTATLLMFGTTHAGSFDIDATLATNLNACKAAPNGAPLKIGFAADFSDLGGFADKPASEAAIYFVELVNCAGGINGSPIEFVVKNIEGDPEVTQRAGQELVSAGMSAILGPPFPDFGEPLLQVTAGKVQRCLLPRPSRHWLTHRRCLSWLPSTTRPRPPPQPSLRLIRAGKPPLHSRLPDLISATTR